ncbi:MAG: AGC protein kinase [Amphiamblys sp. WSBS2006]|nr:MAG: AGC protein kinase [Amphiamblys sp. WSBS2006]
MDMLGKLKQKHGEEKEVLSVTQQAKEAFLDTDTLTKVASLAEESKRKIEYLEHEISRIEHGREHRTLDPPKADFWTSKFITPLLICFKIKEIKYRLLLEKKQARNSEYIVQTCTEQNISFLGKAKTGTVAFLKDPLNRKKIQTTKEKAEETLRLSKQKIRILGEALKRYTPLEETVTACALTRAVSLGTDEGKDLARFTGLLIVDVNWLESLGEEENAEAFLIIDGNLIDRKPINRQKRHLVCSLLARVEEATDIELLFKNKRKIVQMFFGKIAWLAEKTAKVLLEPFGSASLAVRSIVPDSGKKKELLGRRENVVEKVRVLNDHRLTFVHLYSTVARCACCHEFLVGGCYHCSECKLRCHRKCLGRVEGRCRAGHPELTNTHSFQPASVLAVKWCGHCGLALPLGLGACLRCTACGVSVHTACADYVQNTCRKTSRMGSTTDSIRKTAASFGKSSSVLFRRILFGSGNAIEKYSIVCLIGKGSFGRVYLAKDPEGMIVAVKTIAKTRISCKEELEALVEEKKTLRSTTDSRHPFLIQMHACFQDISRVYFVMEYVGGGDLMHRIQQRAFTGEQTRQYAAQIVLALEFLHDRKIIYRDLKLDNILLGLDGYLKVADYGLCKTSLDYTQTTETFCGTPEFIAPEIIQHRKYNMAVDWWSFGVLLYEMLLGRPPFSGEENEDIFREILEKEPEYPQQLSPDEKDLLERLLKKNPEERLGFHHRDIEAIKKLPYFADVSFDDLLTKSTRPAFIPAVKNDLDVSNFDEEFTDQNIALEEDPAEINSDLFDEFENVLNEK